MAKVRIDLIIDIPEDLLKLETALMNTDFIESMIAQVEVIEADDKFIDKYNMLSGVVTE